jgi:putative transposase
MQTAGCARYAYNWGLEKWGKMYEARKADSSLEEPNWVNISRQWTQEKPEWANKTARSAVTCSLSNLGTAFNNFIRRKTKYPKKHKRSQGISFQLGNDTCSIEGNRIRLPNIDYVKLREQPRFQGKITGYTVRLIGSHWYVTVAFDCPDVPREAPESVVGIDVGLLNPAVASDGTVLQLPIEKLQKLEAKRRRAQKALSRSKRNSNARKRKRTKLQRIQQRITNIRQDAVHKFTTTVCKNHATVVTEDLSIQELKDKAPARNVRRAYNSSLMGTIL